MNVSDEFPFIAVVKLQMVLSVLNSDGSDGYPQKIPPESIISVFGYDSAGRRYIFCFNGTLYGTHSSEELKWLHKFCFVCK